MVIVKNAPIVVTGGEMKEKVEGEKINIKRRQASLFPVTSASMSSAKHIGLLWEQIKSKETKSEVAIENGIERNGLDEAESSTQNVLVNNGTQIPVPSLEESCYLDFFGDEKCIRRMLAVEGKQFINLDIHPFITFLTQCFSFYCCRSFYIS